MFLEISREVFGTPIFTRTTHEELNDRNTIMKAEVEGKKQASQKGKKQWLLHFDYVHNMPLPCIPIWVIFHSRQEKKTKTGDISKIASPLNL